MRGGHTGCLNLTFNLGCADRVHQHPSPSGPVPWLSRVHHREEAGDLHFIPVRGKDFNSRVNQKSKSNFSGTIFFHGLHCHPCLPEPDTTHPRDLSETPNLLGSVPVHVTTRTLLWSPRNGFEDPKSSQVPFRIMG